ncbi:hypothetical protein wTkk_001158 [Wolbachia endosymbiont of Trichogramma kaykai]
MMNFSSVAPHGFISAKDPSYGLVDKERHRNRRLFGLHGVGNQNRKT